MVGNLCLASGVGSLASSCARAKPAFVTALRRQHHEHQRHNPGKGQWCRPREGEGAQGRGKAAAEMQSAVASRTYKGQG